MYYVPHQPYPEQLKAVKDYLNGEMEMREVQKLLNIKNSASTYLALIMIIKQLYILNQIKYEK